MHNPISRLVPIKGWLLGGPVSDTSTNIFYLEKQLMYFHVGEPNNSRLRSAFTLLWSVIASVVGRTCVSLTAVLSTAESHGSRKAEQYRGGRGGSVQCKTWKESVCRDMSILWWNRPSWQLLNGENQRKQNSVNTILLDAIPIPTLVLILWVFDRSAYQFQADTVLSLMYFFS